MLLIVPAIGLDFGKGKELPDAPVEIAPYPLVNRSHQPVDPRSKL